MVGSKQENILAEMKHTERKRGESVSSPRRRPRARGKKTQVTLVGSQHSFTGWEKGGSSRAKEKGFKTRLRGGRR